METPEEKTPEWLKMENLVPDPNQSIPSDPDFVGNAFVDGFQNGIRQGKEQQQSCLKELRDKINDMEVITSSDGNFKEYYNMCLTDVKNVLNQYIKE